VNREKAGNKREGILKKWEKWQVGHRRRQCELHASGTTLETRLAEVKHQRELKFQHPEPLICGRLLHAMIH
jgi:hypothetical protein